MADIVFAIGFVALFVYGYCLMSRLDRFVNHASHRQTASNGK